MSSQTTQNIWNFIVRESSLQEMANFGDYSGDFGRFFIYLFYFLFLFGRFQPLIWRPGDTVQNLESPELSGRVDSAAKHRICVPGFDTY